MQQVLLCPKGLPVGGKERYFSSVDQLTCLMSVREYVNPACGQTDACAKWIVLFADGGMVLPLSNSGVQGIAEQQHTAGPKMCKPM